jgi:hypothetical protein
MQTEKQPPERTKQTKNDQCKPPHTSTNVIFILLGGADRNMLDAMVPLKLRVYAFQARLRKDGGKARRSTKKNGAA